MCKKNQKASGRFSILQSPRFPRILLWRHFQYYSSHFKKGKEMGIVGRAYNPSPREVEAGRSYVPGQPGPHSKTLSQKIKYWECSLVADYLPDMHEALSLILSSICVFVYIHMCVCEENIQHMFKI
jgi:hypothetical protein